MSWIFNAVTQNIHYMLCMYIILAEISKSVIVYNSVVSLSEFLYISPCVTII
jgi:hypothetical protein